MPKTDRILLYKIIAGVSFAILCFTQVLHISSMYNLENNRYNLKEKNILKTEYEKIITNDKLFPGASSIIDRFIYRNFDSLNRLAKTDTAQYKVFSKSIYDSLFLELKKANNLDSVLSVIKQRNNIATGLEYAAVVINIDIAFEPNRYLPLYDKDVDNGPTTVPFSKSFGAKIGGRLEDLHPTNQITRLIVSSPLGHTYRAGFALYCDTPDRLQRIILQILPTIVISLISIVAVLLIFLFTLINWQKQKKVSEMKSDFINTITHEFQTPLAAIIVANKTLENESRTLDNQKLHFLNGVIKRQTERLHLLVKQVEETTQAETISLHRETYSLNSLVSEIVADYEVNLQNRNAKTIFEPLAANDRVQLDKQHFTCIVINLINNGVKYNQKPEKRICITTKNSDKETIALSIEDNGEGMSRKVQKNMFTKFYRDPSLTRSNEPGLGLGLYFTKQSLNAHGWRYEVKSIEGTGTVFTIYIPLNHPDHQKQS
jgi:two-component system, OmpR family, phosphate regulon sensor histidine kinase PhoR